MPNDYKLRIREIADLSKDFRVWKIHWIGQCSILSATGEMVIDVWLVPVLNPDKFSLPKRSQTERVYNGNYVFEKARLVKIGVGQLPLLRIGGLYRDGYPCKLPKYITAKFTLPVTEKDQEIIPLKESWGFWEKSNNETTCYYIPARQYQVFFAASPGRDTHNTIGGKKPFKSQCLLVKFPSGERPEIPLTTYPLAQYAWKSERGSNQASSDAQTAEVYGLIIPCIEMVRFYYTKSSQLCREMLFGGLDKNRIFVPEKTIPPSKENPKGFLMLSKYVRDRDAPVIARYAFDDYAMSQARNIYISSVNNLSRRKAALPEARFPFKDVSTNLVVHGTYLQSGNRVYFLVFWIQSCSAKFPFGDVEFWRTNPGAASALKTKRSDVTQAASVPVPDEDGQEVPGGTGSHSDAADYIKTARNFDTIETQSEEIPSEIRAQIELLLREDERFSDLRNHKIEPRQPISGSETERPVHEVQTDIINAGGEETEVGGTAPSGGVKHITPLNFTPDTLPPDPDEIDDLTEENIYEPSPDMPDLTPFLSDENAPDEDEEVVDDDFSDNFSVPDRKQRSEALPINIDVFRGILGSIEKLESGWNARMIEVPVNGPFFKTYKASPFPLVPEELKNLPVYLPRELFIAEIKIDNNRYAYLMDIEAKISSTGNSSRSFTMFLCFEVPSNRRFQSDFLRFILKSCAHNKGKWPENLNKDDDHDRVLEFFYQTSLKHTRGTEQLYAEAIIKSIKDNNSYQPYKVRRDV